MNRPLLDRSAAVAMTSVVTVGRPSSTTAQHQANPSSSVKFPGAAAGTDVKATAKASSLHGPARKKHSGSLDNFDLLKSSLPALREGPTSRPTSITSTSKDNKNRDHNAYANKASNKSPPFAFRLADETSHRIDQILLRSSASTPTTTSPSTTTTGPSAAVTAKPPSVHIQTHVYRRAAERLGLRIREKKNNTTPNESAMLKKRHTTDSDNNHAIQNPMKRRRKTVTFRPTATLSTIERITPSESKAMHRTSEESRQNWDRTIQNARDLRHLCQLYSHEDVDTIRSLAQCLQIDTCTRGVEHYLSQEVYEGRRRAAMRVVDTVLRTQAKYQQRMADYACQQEGQSPSASFVDAMINDIALASASLSRSATTDAMNRGADDEAATRT